MRMLRVNIFDKYHIRLLMDALIKSGTKIPMVRSSVMPIHAFRELFCKWPINSELGIKELRLKTITLMAILLMLRPSDIAPKSVHFDVDSGTTSKFVFSTDNVQFCESGEANITLHGIKNDMSRTGFPGSVAAYYRGQTKSCVGFAKLH